MLPFPDPQNILDKSTEQLELNPHLLPNSSYLIPSVPTIFFPDGFHDLDLSSDGITNAVPTPARPSLPLSDSVPQMVRNMSGCSSSRKRSKRKDRQQSKICTANGQRDPRMRLSIDVAKKFFRLQDMLGFDKASKTVQWLLTMSKAAIKDLTTISSSKICTSSSQSPKCDPSALVCEDSCSLSGSKNKSSTVTAIAREVKKNKAKKEAVKPSRKTEFHLALARESRAKARERARERTREKQRMTSLSSSITFDASKEEHNLKSLPDFAYEEEGKYCKPNQGLNIASDRAYECPMICGSALIPIFENNLGTTAINDACSIFQEQWDMEALSLYRTSLVAFNPNV